MTHLTPKAFAFNGGHSKDAEPGQSSLYGIKFVGLNDSFDHLHRKLLLTEWSESYSGSGKDPKAVTGAINISRP